MSFQVIKCLCLGITTTGLAHEHHVIPQAAGGKDGPTIWLCSNCHGLVHRLAEKLLANNGQVMIDQMRLVHPSRAVQEQLMALAVRVADEMRAKAEGSKDLNPADDISIAVRLPRRAQAGLHRAVAGLKDPRTGRKLGAPTYIASLVLGHLRSKGLYEDG